MGRVALDHKLSRNQPLAVVLESALGPYTCSRQGGENTMPFVLLRPQRFVSSSDQYFQKGKR